MKRRRTRFPADARASLGGSPLLAARSGSTRQADAADTPFQHQAAENPDPPCAHALGIYPSADGETVREDVMAFTHHFPLWSDSISTPRFVNLPSTETIGTSDSDGSVFPVSTRLSKHLETAVGERLETRAIEQVTDLRAPGGWHLKTYASSEARDDVQRITRGPRDVPARDASSG